jgi:hypothetical protein
MNARTDTEALVFQMSADLNRLSKEVSKGRREIDAAMDQIERRNQKLVEKASAAYAQVGRNLKTGLIDRLEGASGPLGEVTSGGGGLAGALGVMAGAATIAATGLFTLARNAMETIGAIKDGADQARITTDTFQALQGTAVQIGAEAGVVGTALAFMSTGMAQAEEETGRLYSTLTKLNPALLEQFKNTTNNEERLRVVAEALREATSENDRLNIVVGAFGRGAGPEMLRILKETGYDLDVLIERMREQGRVIDEEMIAKADAAGDAYDVAMDRIKKAMDRVGASFAPMAASAAEAFADIIDEAGKAGNALDAFLQRLSKYTGLQDQLSQSATTRTNQELNKARADLERYIAANNRPEISAARQRVASLERALAGGSNQALDFPRMRAIGPLAPPVPTPPDVPAGGGGGGSGGGGRSRSGAIRSSGRPAVDAAARELDREIADLQRDGERFSAAVIGQLADLARRAKDAGKAARDAEREGKAADRDKQNDRTLARIDRDLDAINQLGAMVEQFDRDAEDAARNLAEGLVSSALAGKAAFKDFADFAIQQILRVVLQQNVIDPLAGAISGAFKGGPIGTLLSKAFGGFRADGGPVASGRSYVVGERGPELFLPKTDGLIIPAGGFGGATNVTVVVQAQGAITMAEIEQRAAQGAAVGLQAARSQVPADLAARARKKRRR